MKTCPLSLFHNEVLEHFWCFPFSLSDRKLYLFTGVALVEVFIPLSGTLTLFLSFGAGEIRGECGFVSGSRGISTGVSYSALGKYEFSLDVCLSEIRSWNFFRCVTFRLYFTPWSDSTMYTITCFSQDHIKFSLELTLKFILHVLLHQNSVSRFHLALSRISTFVAIHLVLFFLLGVSVAHFLFICCIISQEWKLCTLLSSIKRIGRANPCYRMMSTAIHA